MKPFNHDVEMRKQVLAEAAELAAAPPDHDADVEAYRRVIRFAARPLPDALAADFAAQLMAQLATKLTPPEEVGILERWLPGVGLAALAIVALISSNELLVNSGRQLVELGAGNLPWPMLCAAALSLAAVGLFDRILSKR